MTIDPGSNWRYPGARWWKFDFHTHPPAAQDYGKSSYQATLPNTKPRDWLLNFMRAGIDCVVVIDHHSGEGIGNLQNALDKLQKESPIHKDFRQLYLFPGLEINTSDGVKILALLDCTKTANDAHKLLKGVGYIDEAGGIHQVSKSSAEVVNKIITEGYIPILAHVNNSSGIFEVKEGSFTWNRDILETLYQIDDLVAIEATESEYCKPSRYNELKLSWPEVVGSNSHNATEVNKNNLHTWVKMEYPSFEGIRLALIDGQRFSIRRSNDPKPYNSFPQLPEHFIEAIEVRDAQYMGHGEPVKVAFNPWFNAIIGGRGTGKSTLIHALRIASNRIDELKDLYQSSTAARTFERFNKVPKARDSEGGLTKETNINWTVNRHTITHLIKWCYEKTENAREVFEAENGHTTWLKSSNQIVNASRFPLRILSQGQIAELAGDAPQALLKVIDDAAALSISYASNRLTKATDKFYTLRSRLREFDRTLAQEQAIDLELQDIEHKLARFEAMEHATKLKRYRISKRQSREIDLQFKSVGEKLLQIQKQLDKLSTDEVPPNLFDHESTEDRYILSILEDLKYQIDTNKTNIENTIEHAQEYIERCRIRGKNSNWYKSVEQAIKDYEELQHRLKNAGLTDPNAYAYLLQDRQRLLTEKEKLISLRYTRNKIEKDSQYQLMRLLKERKRIAKSRQDFLVNVLHDNQYVRIQLEPYGNDERAVEQSLRHVLGISDGRFASDILKKEDDKPPRGIIVDLLNKYPDSANLGEDSYVNNASDNLESKITTSEQRIHLMKERLERGCLGRGDFGKWFNDYLERSYDEQPAFLDRIWTWFPGDGLLVQYSQTGDGKNFKPITQASAGQKAAAMLAFLLTHGDEPLVLDQPEDDLDNALIYDLVVHQIRENKLRRQIIIVTHNPNIVVNGDAEMLHVLGFSEGQCKVVGSGSIQKLEIQEAVCNIMEGGKEALKFRYQKLGIT